MFKQNHVVLNLYDCIKKKDAIAPLVIFKLK